MSGAVSGILYHLFSGQPLVIVGATGPLLVFESILYMVCRSVKYDTLSQSTYRFRCRTPLVCARDTGAPNYNA